MSDKVTTEFKRSVFNTKILIVSIVFTIAFLFWEFLAIGVYDLETLLFYYRFIKVFNTWYIFFLLGYSFVHFIICFVFVYATIASTPIPKIFLLVIFSVALFFEYGYSNALGRYSELIDIQVIAHVTNVEHQLSAIWLYFSGIALAPILLFAVISFSYRPSGFTRNRWVFLVPIILSVCVSSLFSVVLKPMTAIGVSVPTVSVSNFFQTLVDFEITEFRTFRGDRDTVEIDSAEIEENIEKKNIILITEEAVRADHMSLNGYARSTTPFLEELEKRNRIENYGIAISGSTASISSAALFLTGMKVSDLPDKEQSLQRLPTIFQYAKAMGYKTHFLDGQMTASWNGTHKDLKYIDNWKNAKYFSDRAGNTWDVDARIAEEIAAITKKSTGNFIWVWKKGVHYPYYDDFPTGRAAYKPISRAAQDRTVGRERLVNTYDSGITYNIDRFFRLLMPIVEQDSTAVVIYTADHGESLLEDGKTRTHGGSNVEQAKVPFITTGKFAKDFHKDVPIMHEYVFPTILDLLQVPESARRHEYSSSLLDPNASFPKKREFWGMDLTSGAAISFE